MQTSKMYERIKWYKKEFVHNQYARIVNPFKNYEKITKTKMLEAVYKVYSDYNNIINICTVRELKYLKMILDKKASVEELNDEKYEWERSTLHDKFLVQSDIDRVFIPDEIIDKVKEAIKNVNYDEAKKLDELNELLVSYCKIQASSLLDTVCLFVPELTGLPKDVILDHIFNNKLFNYYVIVYTKDIEGLGEDIPVLLYQDYYGIEEQIEEERKKQGLAGSLPIDKNTYKTLFYNDFDINNKKISKFLEEIKKLPFFWFSTLDTIRDFAVLNIDREPLKKSIANVYSLRNYDLEEFFKVLDEAMDEMPSGVLNGFTPNQAKEIKLKELKRDFDKERNYVKQTNACISRKDAKLFYKIYFALLEFTNNKYKIKPKLKIYNKYGIDPQDITDIIDVFWKNKDSLVLEFCFANPYKFNAEELKITREFKNGLRQIYVIVKFEEEYTAFMSMDKTYMVKGINDNLDNIIPFMSLPYPVITTIIPFKDVLIYDAILMSMGIKMGIEIDEALSDYYSNSIKYYHL